MIVKEKKESKENIKMYTCIYCQHRKGLWPVTRQTRPPVREDAPRQTKLQLSWLRPTSCHESQRGSMPRWTDWL